MTIHEFAALLAKQLAAKGITRNGLADRLEGRCSPQTIYNAVAGKPIKTDTMLLMLDELGLTITRKDSK